MEKETDALAARCQGVVLRSRGRKCLRQATAAAVDGKTPPRREESNVEKFPRRSFDVGPVTSERRSGREISRAESHSERKAALRGYCAGAFTRRTSRSAVRPRPWRHPLMRLSADDPWASSGPHVTRSQVVPETTFRSNAMRFFLLRCLVAPDDSAHED